MNMKNKSDESISSLLIDNQSITSAKQIYNHLNNVFTSIAEKNKQNFCQSKKTHISNTIFISRKVPEDLEDLISSMKTNKASVPSNIPTNILVF